MEHYYTYDKVDVPFHMADKKEKAKGDVSMGLGNDKDGSIVYLNFSNDDPVINGMKKGIDTFDKEISVPVMIDKSNQYGPDTISVTFDDKYDIGWRGANGDHHVIKTYPNDTWMVDAKSVSVEPKFDVATPVQTMRERMIEKLKAKALDIDEHKPDSMDRSITD